MLKIKNKDARRLWLASHLLGDAPTGPLDVVSIIKGLGFVQLDTLQILSRAHHHILWSRNQNYREHMFDPLLAKDRAVFEHFTHDASILPMDTLPYWRRQFDRKHKQIVSGGWYKNMSDKKGRAEIKDRIRREGALSSHAFDTKNKAPGQVWSRPPHKLALDFMWYSGELATCYRQNFKKFYNLSERVFPADLVTTKISDADQIDWLCRQAIDRLGFATAAEIKNFWDAMTLPETRNWLSTQNDLVAVSIEGADGVWRDAMATSDIEDRLTNTANPTSRLRILNPFDPAIRDRVRLKRLFGMDYKIEIFVPAAKRKYGYYVYPILQGSRFVGRVEAVANRKQATLDLKSVWPEDGVDWTPSRQAALDQELKRMARFINCQYQG